MFYFSYCAFAFDFQRFKHKTNGSEIRWISPLSSDSDILFLKDFEEGTHFFQCHILQSFSYSTVFVLIQDFKYLRISFIFSNSKLCAEFLIISYLTFLLKYWDCMGFVIELIFCLLRYFF